MTPPTARPLTTDRLREDNSLAIAHNRAAQAGAAEVMTARGPIPLTQFCATHRAQGALWEYVPTPPQPGYTRHIGTLRIRHANPKYILDFDVNRAGPVRIRKKTKTKTKTRPPKSGGRRPQPSPAPGTS